MTGGARSGRAPFGAGTSEGQASVELVGLLPLVVCVGFAILQVLAAGAAHEAADGAAEAGAVALLQDQEPGVAARAALPGWARERAAITVHGRRVAVHVRPRGPVAAVTGRLVATAVADAGPEAGGSP